MFLWKITSQNSTFTELRLHSSRKRNRSWLQNNNAQAYLGVLRAYFFKNNSVLVFVQAKLVVLIDMKISLSFLFSNVKSQGCLFFLWDQLGELCPYYHANVFLLWYCTEVKGEKIIPNLKKVRKAGDFSSSEENRFLCVCRAWSSSLLGRERKNL